MKKKTVKTNEITIEEVRAYKALVTSSKEASEKFLEQVGIIKNGKLTPPYREDKSRVSYRWGSDNDK